jgi:hypothetical protein
VKIAVKKAVSIVLTISVMVCVTLASYLSINWLNVSAEVIDKDNLKNLVDQVAGYQSDMFKAAGWDEFVQSKAEAEAVLSKTDATQEEVNSAYAALDTAVKALRANFETLAFPKSDSNTTLTEVSGAEGILATPSGVDFAAYKAENVNKNQRVGLTANIKNLSDYTRLIMYVRAENVTDPIGNIRLQVMDSVTWSGDPVSFDVVPAKDKWVMLTLDLRGTKLQEFVNGSKQVGGYALWIDFACEYLYISSVYAVKPAIDKGGLTNLMDQVAGYQSDMFEISGWEEFLQARSAAEEVLAKTNATQEEVNSAYAALDTAVKALQAKFEAIAIPKSDSNTTLTEVSGAEGVLAKPSGIADFTVYKAVNVNKNQRIALTAQIKNLKDYIRLFMYVRVDNVSGSIGNIRFEVMDSVTWSGDPVSFDVVPAKDKWVMLTLDLRGTKLQEFMNGSKQVGGYALWIDFACESLYISSIYGIKAADKSSLLNLVNEAEGYKKEKYSENGWSDFEEKLDAARQVLSKIGATEEEIQAAYDALDAAMKALEPLYGEISYLLGTLNQEIVTGSELEGLDVPETPVGISDFPIYKITSVTKDARIGINAKDKNLKNYDKLYVYVRAEGLSVSKKMRVQVMGPPNWNDTPVYFDTELIEGKWVKMTVDLKGQKLKEFMDGTKEVGAYAFWVDFDCETLYISDLYASKETEMETIYKLELINLYNKVKDYKEELFALAGWAEFQDALRRAQQVINGAGYNKSDIDAAYNALKSAVDALIPTSKEETEILAYTRLTKVSDSVREGLNVPEAPEEIGNYNIYSADNVTHNMDIRFQSNDLEIQSYYQVYVYVLCEGYSGGALNLQIMDRKTWNGQLVAFNGTIKEGEWSLLTIDLSKAAFKDFMDGTKQAGAYALWTHFTCDKMYISDLYGKKIVSTKISTARLEQLLERAEKLNEEDYTISSWANFQKALNEARKVLEIEEIMDRKIVDNAVSMVELAWSGLELYNRRMYAEMGTLFKEGNIFANGIGKNSITLLDYGRFPVEFRSALHIAGWNGSASNMIKITGLTLDLTDHQILEFYIKVNNLTKNGMLILALHTSDNKTKSVEVPLKSSDNGKDWVRQEIYIEDFGFDEDELSSVVALSFALKDTKGDITISSIYANKISYLTPGEVPFVKYPFGMSVDEYSGENDWPDNPTTGEVFLPMAVLVFCITAAVLVIIAKKQAFGIKPKQ